MTVCTDRGHHGPMIDEGDSCGSWQRCADCGNRTSYRPAAANPFFDPALIARAMDRRCCRAAVIGVLILAAVAVLFLWFGATTLG